MVIKIIDARAEIAVSSVISLRKTDVHNASWFIDDGTNCLRSVKASRVDIQGEFRRQAFRELQLFDRVFGKRVGAGARRRQ